MSPVTLGFHGAAGTVTGSRYLLTVRGRQVLVDCGLFQGLKQLRLRNRARFPAPPSDIEAVVLTHAHLDHSGYLPVLVRDGFRGAVFATEPTFALCSILLPDSGYLQEEEAERANRLGYSRHTPSLPLYTRADAIASLDSFGTVPFHRPHEAGPVTFTFRQAGHILGAASALVSVEGLAILFSGDVGRPMDPLLYPPEPVPEADYLVVESTYGERTHPRLPPADELAEVIRRTAGRGGVVVIPAFAVGRAQSLLYHVHALRQAGEIPDVPVFLDSPMAADATDLMSQYSQYHRLDREQCAAVFGSARITNSPEESKAIDRRSGPMIIISASGMATGGRVLFHIRRFADDPRNTIVLVGHQAAGTRGSALQQGARELKMHGVRVSVHAEVVSLHGLSAHADADELMAWLGTAPRPPRKVFVTHGEPSAADALRFRIQDELGWPALVPEHGQVVDL
ncbi:MAG TPA: MBL fold metallo-hydrolase [Longimicrobiales bacterium]|nr:MBL fold metallo-hydrolase [Longimicrobiales bacterium]